MPQFLTLPLVHFRLTFESIKELGNASLLNIWSNELMEASNTSTKSIRNCWEKKKIIIELHQIWSQPKNIYKILNLLGKKKGIQLNFIKFDPNLKTYPKFWACWKNEKEYNWIWPQPKNTYKILNLLKKWF